jgi:hypothetical protein
VAPERPEREAEVTPPAALDPSPAGALRRLYLEALERLAERRLLSLSTAHTNGDYLRMLQNAALQPRLARLTALFERTQYGRATPSHQELEEARALTRALAGHEQQE